MNRTTLSLIALGLSAVAASASSIVSIAPPAPGDQPSILVPTPLPDSRTKISDSMIALGDPEPAVSDERVASVSTKSSPVYLPIMIRGGMVSNGGASASVPITQSAPSGSGASAANPTGSKAIAKMQARKAARDARREATDNPQPMAKDNTPAPVTGKPQ